MEQSNMAKNSYYCQLLSTFSVVGFVLKPSRCAWITLTFLMNVGLCSAQYNGHIPADKTCEIPLADRTPCVSGGNVSFYDIACQLDSINVTSDMCTCPWDEQAWIDNFTITCDTDCGYANCVQTLIPKSFYYIEVSCNQEVCCFDKFDDTYTCYQAENLPEVSTMIVYPAVTTTVEITTEQTTYIYTTYTDHTDEPVQTIKGPKGVLVVVSMVMVPILVILLITLLVIFIRKRKRSHSLTPVVVPEEVPIQNISSDDTLIEEESQYVNVTHQTKPVNTINTPSKQASGSELETRSLNRSSGSLRDGKGMDTGHQIAPRIIMKPKARKPTPSDAVYDNVSSKTNENSDGKHSLLNSTTADPGAYAGLVQQPEPDMAAPSTYQVLRMGPDGASMHTAAGEDTGDMYEEYDGEHSKPVYDNVNPKSEKAYTALDFNLCVPRVARTASDSPRPKPKPQLNKANSNIDKIKAQLNLIPCKSQPTSLEPSWKDMITGEQPTTSSKIDEPDELYEEYNPDVVYENV